MKTKKTLAVEKTQFKDRLHQVLESHHFPDKNKGRIQCVADLMNYSHRGAGKWLDGSTVPPLKKCLLLAEKLNVNGNWLATGKGNWQIDSSPKPPKIKETTQVPFFHHLKDLNNPHYVPSLMIACYAPTLGSPFAISLESEAMSPKFTPGTILVFDPKKIPKDGDFILINNHFSEAQFRQLVIVNDRHYLEACNPRFERLSIKTEDKRLGTLIQALMLY